MLYENRKVIVPLRVALEFKLRTHEDQGLFPSRPVLTRKDSKEPVERGQARPGGFRFKTASCCRRKKFPSHRLRRLRKRRTIEDRQTPITCNIAGYYRK